MAQYLADTGIFEEVVHPWDEVAAGIEDRVKAFGFKPGDGIPYNYGIWKPKKQRFRYIAGTRTRPRPDSAQEGVAQADHTPPPGPPRSPAYHLCKALVTVLDHVANSLQTLNEQLERESGLRCYWPIKSVDQFSRYVRVHADDVVRDGMATYDFTTMYTSLDQEVILKNVMDAFQEAQQHEASRAPTGQSLPSMTVGGWVFGEGWSLEDIQDMVRFSLETAYTVNGGLVRRQVKGIPMGIPHAPQLANLACYPIEKPYFLSHQPRGLICS